MTGIGLPTLNSRHEPANPLVDTPVQAAIRAHDKATRFCDSHWGVDVLKEFVSPETAAAYAKAEAGRDKAIMADDEDKIIAWCGSCVRGMKKMHEEALAAGNKPLDPRVIPFRDANGKQYLFTVDDADARAAVKSPKYKTAQVWSLEEVTRMMNSATFEKLMEVKETFREAQVTELKLVTDSDLNDEVPAW